ncbi:MAG TPA: SIS domain-containing protein [Candidatus Pygmaiobacter gallistercoris]|nr:SIS domain-containing protein [Candidatus Pygmaiobacter gallistercoris]
MAHAVNLTNADAIAACVQDVMDKMRGRGGLKEVYAVACGGSLSGCYPLYYLLRSEAKQLRSDCISANEFVWSTPKAVGANSLVVCMSRSGTTPETVAAAHKARALGALVVTLSINEADPLQEQGDYNFVWAASNEKDSYEYSNSALVLRLGFELLKAVEGYAKFDAAAGAFEKIDRIIRSAIAQAQEKADRFAQEHQDDFAIYTLGSGPVYNIAYSTCICHLMEMEWINSSSFHTGEFFHGPFEITDKKVPFLLFMSSGRTRALDERAKDFLARYTECLEVLDAEDYGALELDEGVREFFDNLILAAVGRVYTETLAVYKQHPFAYRKYMFKVEY